MNDDDELRKEVAEWMTPRVNGTKPANDAPWYVGTLLREMDAGVKACQVRADAIKKDCDSAAESHERVRAHLKAIDEVMGWQNAQRIKCDVAHVGKTDDGAYHCSACGYTWKARSRYLWWPIRFAAARKKYLDALGERFGVSRWGWEVGHDFLEQHVFGQTFELRLFGVSFMVMLGTEAFPSKEIRWGMR